MRRRMDFCHRTFASTAVIDGTDPRAAPLLAANFKQLAPAFVLTAGYDPLADEGMAYARKLEDNGVPVTLVHICARKQCTSV